MAHKELKFNEDARRALERGVNTLADADHPLAMVSYQSFDEADYERLLWRFLLDPNLGMVNAILGAEIPWTTGLPWAWIGIGAIALGAVAYFATRDEPTLSDLLVPVLLVEAPKSALAVRSRSQEVITLPCLHTSAIAARSKSY